MHKMFFTASHIIKQFGNNVSQIGETLNKILTFDRI